MKEQLLKQARENREAKYAIALSASANSGKTSTLKIFIDSFRNERTPIVAMSDIGNGVDEMWCFEKDGVRIGIATGGDDGNAVTKAFDFFLANQCQIVFCATRYKSDSTSWDTFFRLCQKHGYAYEWQGCDGYSPDVLEVMNRDLVENVLRKML